MIKVKVHYTTRLEIKGILGYMERTVTPHGTGAKVLCPKEFLGKKVILVILKD